MKLAFALMGSNQRFHRLLRHAVARALTTAPSLAGVSPAAEGSHSSRARAQAPSVPERQPVWLTADFRRSTAVGAKQPWRAGPTTRRQCRCSGLGIEQLGSEPWRCTVDASLLLIDEIDCPRVRRSLT